jgi:hypothetical protein
MPGTKNRHEQAPSNARKRQEEHRERVAALRARRRKSPERQARLHPSRAFQRAIKAMTKSHAPAYGVSFIRGTAVLTGEALALNADALSAITDHGTMGTSYEDAQVYDTTASVGPILSNEQIILRAIGVDPAAHPLPWRAPDKKRRPGGDWMILDANGDVAEYAKSRDKARARVREVNG